MYAVEELEVTAESGSLEEALLNELDEYLENIPKENLQLSPDEIQSFRNKIKKGAKKQFSGGHFQSQEALGKHLVSSTDQSPRKTTQAQDIATSLYDVLDAARTFCFCMLEVFLRT